MNYKLDKQIVHNDVLRNSFIDLAIKTFDLSFKEWYRKGYWTTPIFPTPW
ncbi:acetyltransferase [Klebsiella michiganensis]|uniref:Acetyltransferase n=1 Tax=Klebsiella michiganensis TaxID=1134687 RepID=A0A7H4LY75_9ENTR|nr:acetyltransferase [Klebsiella michiganensis]